jgi:DNA adenine methylase
LDPVDPLLKWPGGKRALFDSITEYMPKEFGRYWEPFIGGGAVYFALSPPLATISDANEELMETYRAVRDAPEELIQRLSRMSNSEDEYYRIRRSRPRSRLGRAARFIYLCSLSFNGIHRYNLRGEFNVPYGFKTHLDVCDEQKIHECSKRLRRSSIVDGDFEKVVKNAKEGDLLYFDPPYTVAHNNNGFVKYNASIFSWKDQIRLAECARAARQRGCYVLVSNADHSSLKALYHDFNCQIIKRHSVMASSSAFRKPITEALFWSHPK